MTKNKILALRVSKIIVIVVVILVITIMLRNIMIKINYPQKYNNYIEKYATEFGVEQELIYAMIKAESNFKPEATSNKQALGLMQILESTANDVAKELEIQVTKEEILNPEINIRLGTKYISNLIKRYGNIELAIASYNAGIGNVDNWIKEGTIKQDGTDMENIPFKETNNYIRKVLRNYEIYRKICN